ncbi:hypothetical protein IFM89_039374 [Coptis chinensis]|uniref:Uncharacterized protein n=1 Tax=Coptis chinensis TaxID=261450 RepID=A0A835HSF8_9MAGN|nr:hypothetical protein IFM89_039374 [Coptis chinensis]
MLSLPKSSFVLIGILEALGLLLSWDVSLRFRHPRPILSSIVVSDYTQMDRILKEERNYILGMIKKIKGDGCNVLLIRKSILRDAVLDLSLHYLSKAKILVVKDVERDAIEFITKTLNCLPIANIEHFREEKMGRLDCVERGFSW